MSGQDGSASGTSRPPRIPAPAAAEQAAQQAAEQSVVADYTETVVPAGARRSNFRMLLTFGSMQLAFGAVLVGYDARFQGLSLGRLIVAMAAANWPAIVALLAGTAVGVSTGGLIPGTSGFGKT